MRKHAIVVANLAIPTWCCLVMFAGAFGIFPMPDSIVQALGATGAIWFAQGFFWSCLAIVVGLIVQLLRPSDVWLKAVPVYVWFEYPGLITASFLAITYAAAVVVAFGFASFVAAGFALAIGTRFFFRWLELHLTYFRGSEDGVVGADPRE